MRLRSQELVVFQLSGGSAADTSRRMALSRLVHPCTNAVQQRQHEGLQRGAGSDWAGCVCGRTGAGGVGVIATHLLSNVRRCAALSAEALNDLGTRLHCAPQLGGSASVEPPFECMRKPQREWVETSFHRQEENRREQKRTEENRR
jgi:hypothetical protein